MIRMSDEIKKLTAAQLRAIRTFEGPLFIAAGAGSGKTAVVTRRFVQAVASGFASVDEILTITFTRKAAAEMMERIRCYLRKGETVDASGDGAQEERMLEAYRKIESARISTIDSFCASLLRANALAAGIDPGFAAADESRAVMLQEEAFDAALKELVARWQNRDKAAVIGFITAYDPDVNGKLFKIVKSVYEKLRSQGKAATLPQPQLPDVEAAKLELSGAIRDAQEAINKIDKPGSNLKKCSEQLSNLAAALEQAEPVKAEEAVKDSPINPGNLGKMKPAIEPVKECRRIYLTALCSHAAAGALDFFRELLETFHQEYSRKKEELGLLDFADLTLKARELLLQNEDIKQKTASSFRLVMVDEYQDTNPLQDEMIRLISGENLENLMVVGDENQSIYGFRDADVSLFRQQRERARRGGWLIELKKNFRSHPQVLDFADHVFNSAGMLSPGYLKLQPGAKPDGCRENCRVEVILVNNSVPSPDDPSKTVTAKGGITRAAEAGEIAARLRRLFNDPESGFCAGDAAILLRTRASVDFYCDALTQAGIESYLAAGSGYHEKLELRDVVSMFKLIVNPLDDLAMLSVLRSPYVGLSDEALFWLRQPLADEDMTETPIWPSLKQTGRLDRLELADREKLLVFSERLKQMRLAAGRETLRALAARAINSGDYAAMVLAGEKGRQDFANLMKLLDMADDFEDSWGSGVAEFAEFLERQKEAGAREVEAPTEAEGVDAVRIMTMHSAKGLEFPLVVLPDLGNGSSGGKRDSSVLLVDRGRGSRIGLQYKTGGAGGDSAFDYDELKIEQDDREIEERKRLLYVAMTRAERLLIVSGVAPAGKKGDMQKNPFSWLRCRLGMPWGVAEISEDGCYYKTFGDAKTRLRICADPEGAAARSPQAGDAAAGGARIPEIREEINRMPGPAVHVPPAITPTALDAYAACPRRYWLENVLRAGELFPETPAAAAEAKERLSNTEIGSLIHKVLEQDLLLLKAGPFPEGLLAERAAQALGPGAELTPADHERVQQLLSNFLRAPVAGELIAAAASARLKTRLKTEVSFSTLIGQTTILSGQMDAVCPPSPGGKNKGGASTLVVDYKTSARDGSHEAAGPGGYRYQAAAYALAAARLNRGPVRVVLLYLGGEDPEQVEQEYSFRQAATLETELQALIGGMSKKDFPPLPKFDAYRCKWCAGGPNKTAICAAGFQP